MNIHPPYPSPSDGRYRVGLTARPTTQARGADAAAPWPRSCFLSWYRRPQQALCAAAGALPPRACAGPPRAALAILAQQRHGVEGGVGLEASGRGGGGGRLLLEPFPDSAVVLEALDRHVAAAPPLQGHAAAPAAVGQVRGAARRALHLLADLQLVEGLGLVHEEEVVHGASLSALRVLRVLRVRAALGVCRALSRNGSLRLACSGLCRGAGSA
eukprot:CAMPEP_0206251666 /NCGR_PEP_ID=MMETSP0047_2-20121206/22152_1 /ASSEMBLY_ACC=CAM_ASM_000192 /TAXON_ID=195065 /ORGANISM="Chroomonas mesostigmatica_cf, Strain CCMP1168" /LENGTH=213 /DNA_ID=CAMNT_0053677647 /DNA_START=231 /DNA_END=869 /DNA_ORIENTATION=-